MPANFSTGSNAELAAGMHPLTNAGRGNDFTMSPDGMSDTGLQADSARFNDLVPHGVVRPANTGPDDTGFEPMDREQGQYTPGAMEAMMDRLSEGANDNAA